jgi:hypothetical protein
MTSSNRWTDGSTLAGPVADLFRVDLSTAVGRCTACGRTTPMAHCLACDQVLLRLVRGPGRAWLDLRGLTYLQLPVPKEPKRHDCHRHAGDGSNPP